MRILIISIFLIMRIYIILYSPDYTQLNSEISFTTATDMREPGTGKDYMDWFSAETGLAKKFYSGTFSHATFPLHCQSYRRELSDKNESNQNKNRERTFPREPMPPNIQEDWNMNRNQKQEKKKSYSLLVIGAVLLIAGLIFTVYAYHTSYQESTVIGKQLSEAKEQQSAVKEGTGEGDLEALDAEVSQLSEEKLSLERPYSYGLTLVFFAILLTAKGIYNAVVGIGRSKKADVKRLAQAGLLAALCYIGFAFFKIDIPVGPEKTAFHFGNVFCVLAALLLGGYWGGLAGAVGMTIGDLTTAYVTSAPKTFFLKLCIGLITGLVAHKIFHINDAQEPKKVTIATVVACFCGMAFNVVADPVVGYFYKTYLLGVPQDISAALAKIATLTTGVNAVVAVIAASVFYLALRPALKKSGLFVEL